MTVSAVPPLPTRGRVLALATPVIFANVGVSLAGIADTAVMGRMDDTAYLSATAIGAAVFSTLYGVFIFLRMSTGGLIAQAHGARDELALRHVLLRALVMATGIGLLLLIFHIPLLSLALSVVQNDGRLHALITEYVTIRIWSAPAVLALFVLHGTLVGRQSMRALLIVQLVQTGLNVSLNVAFFQLTDLAIQGVALATVLADYLALTLAIVMLLPVLIGDTGPWRRWLLDSSATRRLFTLSGDLFLRSVFLTAAYFWLTAAGSHLGVEAVAVNAILLLFALFTAHFLDGFAHAAEALVGSAIGARQPVVLRAAIHRSAELALMTSLLLTLSYVLLAPVVVDFMTTDFATRSATREMLHWVWLLPLAGMGSFLLDGIFIGATATRAMRDTVFLACVGFFASTALLMPIFGNNGLWAAYLLMQIVRALGLWWFLPRLLGGVVEE